MRFPLTDSGGKGDADRSDKKAFKDGFDKVNWSSGMEEIKARRREREEKRYQELCATVNAPMIMKPLDTFISPIDMSVISDRTQLRAHNKKHGVCNIAEYGDGHFEREGKRMHQERQGGTKADKADRREKLRETMHRMGMYD